MSRGGQQLASRLRNLLPLHQTKPMLQLDGHPLDRIEPPPCTSTLLFVGPEVIGLTREFLSSPPTHSMGWRMG